MVLLCLALIVPSVCLYVPHRVAFGYLDFFGRAVFGANGLPRPLMRRDQAAPPPPTPPQPRAPAAAGDGEREEDQAPVEGGEGDAAAVAAAGAGAGAGASLANAPDATGAAAAVVPAERPPLTFLGNVGNIALAFVTSLFPSWEG
jgi:hypothetical protein